VTLQVHRHVHHHRARAAGLREAEGLAEPRRDLRGRLQAPGGLGDGPGHGHDVGLLEALLADGALAAQLRARDLTAEEHRGGGVEVARRDPGEQVRRPRPARGHRDAGRARHAGGALRGERGGLLVVHAHEPCAPAPGDRVDQVRDRPADDLEHVAGALRGQEVGDVVRGLHRRT
jgi:hypothetical protein